MSHLFAYLSRMKFIKRWSLMHTAYPENIEQHSLRVAMIAHALATIRNRLFGGAVNADRAATLALYHDAGEVLTGDLPAPVKYANPELRAAYHAIETAAAQKLFGMVPDELKDAYRPLFFAEADDLPLRELVKAADKLAAWLKCLEEVAAGNQEFSKAEKTLRETVHALELPEARYFLERFAPGFRLTLDELG